MRQKGALGGAPASSSSSVAANPGVVSTGEQAGTAAADRAPHRRLIFFICSVALFMTSINGSMVGTALPRIGNALHTTINWTGWTITIYQLGQVLAAPISGRISDQFGRKKVFLVCIAIFTSASMLCGLSRSIEMLLPLRFIQALGGGAFIASASGIVADHFGKDRDRAIGMFTSITPIGSIVGPVIGGVIAQYWSWRGVFFVNVPIGILLLTLTTRFVPRGGTRETGRFDVTGVVQLASLIIAGMLTITLLGEKHASVAIDIAPVCALVAIVMAVVFIKHIKRVESPFIPPRLLLSKEFVPINLVNLLYGTAALGFATMVPLYAENRYTSRSPAMERCFQRAASGRSESLRQRR